MGKIILAPFQEDLMNFRAIIDLRGGNIEIPLTNTAMMQTECQGKGTDVNEHDSDIDGIIEKSIK